MLPAYNLAEMANLLRSSSSKSASAFLPFLEKNSQISIETMQKVVKETMAEFKLNSIEDAILILKTGKLPNSDEDVTKFVKEMTKKHAMPVY